MKLSTVADPDGEVDEAAGGETSLRADPAMKTAATAPINAAALITAAATTNPRWRGGGGEPAGPGM
ncbi:hypothetical protein [Mycobacteroides abscessus]|uniref:hypothetical protein n=1 Tax=Mycobacteroides abscessus TaxID=36809 RepID=UPI0010424177|nr:hypothetical protein [Mycobacteroides abscessus]MBN7298521.1 hypothetical protein [Mycobacteroides abscessus subsp. abscessus]